MTRVVYIVSDIDKALAFEWVASHISKEKFQLSFILLTQKPSYLETFLKEKGIDCRPVYYGSKKDFPRVLMQIYRILRGIRPATVHCHLLFGALLGLTAARIAGIKNRIYTRHHSDFHHRYFPGGIKWDKWCNRLATTIVAPSNAVKVVLTAMEGVDPRKIIIIPHGFDLDYFGNVAQDRVEHLRQKYNPRNKRPVIGVIARFTELKGIQYIIPAFRRVLALHRDATILFFNAKGDYADTITGLLQDLPQDSYRLIPFENELNAVYPLFDIFIQASTDTTIEAFGQTYVEALAAGIPSVFTLSGIAPDFIRDGENALVVPFKDSEAIFAAVKRILDSPTLQQSLKQHGQASVKNQFSLDTMIQKLEVLYAG